MSLCIKCSNSTLLQIPWKNLQPIGEESKVVHSWMKADSIPDCALCQLVESEIRATGQHKVGRELSMLMYVAWSFKLFPDSPTN